MLHLGDITKINGHIAPVVDVVIGGSPCQDLSIAGKRAGLDGERSGLFMEQIRIIKEMRDETSRRANGHIRPRYMVWENVYGAFSSNKGEDFRIVLEETAKVTDKNAVIPRPADGKWKPCGCIVGDGWSIAWRVLDAQFWGVPQRRRRIALVADFGGQSAPEILFVSKSVSGHSKQGESKREEAPCNASRSVGTDDSIGFDGYNGELTGDKVATLGVNCGLSTGRNGCLDGRASYTLKIRGGCEGGGKGALIQTEKPATLSTLQDQTLFQTVVYDARGNGDGKTVCTITGDHCNRVTDYTPVLAINQGGGKSQSNVQKDLCPTLTCTHGGEPAVCYGLGLQSSAGIGAIGKDVMHTLINGDNFGWQNGVCHAAKAVDCRNCTEDDVNGALQSNSAHSLNGNNVVRCRYIVRRLTPLECERLQGYPDGWTDIGEWTDSNGKKHNTTDSPRYKALGNSIALPPWKWVLKRICACYERDATMASLFDGIGGFPYLWEQLNGKGTCLWASEIEEFPIAVTKRRIGE